MKNQHLCSVPRLAVAGFIAASLAALAAPAQADDRYGSYRGYDRGYDGSTRLVYCESDEYRRETCPTYGTASRVWIEDRKSDARCNEGRDWGYDRDRIWVANGCRAVFAVQYAGGYGQPGYSYGRPGYDRPGNGYGRPGHGRSAVERRFWQDNIRGARFDGVNYIRQDRDGRGWMVSLDYDIGRGYRGGGRDRDIQCHYERGEVRLINYTYAGDYGRGRGRH